MQNPQSFLQQQRQSASPPPQAPAILGGYEPISYTSFMSQSPLYPAYLNISTLIQSCKPLVRFRYAKLHVAATII